MEVTERQDLRAAALARKAERSRIARELLARRALPDATIAEVCCISANDMKRLAGQMGSGTR